MRVAIIGAGISGLACAHELERFRIFPDIYEERSRTGELFPHVGGLLQLMNRPVRDQLKWLEKDYHIKIKPLNTWKKLTMHAPHVSKTVHSGKLGYFVERGQGDQSLEVQLNKMIKSPIYYNCQADYSELAREYDYVVVASGNREIAATLGIWKDIFITMVRGAIVLGDFNPEELKMWVNTDYALGAYAYLTAFNRTRASLVLIHANTSAKEMEKIWHTFLKKENLDYQITEGFLLSHVAGTVFPHQVRNILLVGSAGGFMESFLGFGAISSLRSGVLAARAIAKNLSFDKLSKRLDEEMRRSVRLREIINTMKNEDYDRLVTVATLPVIKQIAYNSNFPLLKYAGDILELSRASVDWEKKSILPSPKKQR
ncbi:NAD(P)/FAD-dependent oxidoreductase [Desulforamulus ruminis]|uniref:FAD dependent oxidoreductase n=1 Tax=Desulforamulus ruminis (strain ATCC 23193 / DSM 2154 / NCIMB 8452 / DL) TaxID=696281 RepID=F6DL64_DESRL|nr:NAD(P)-binding protein [Desulforamulus ruminis]AEG59285.1 FAD dependent oxidoreductase [Desulforamulus ruminis DSM 2154]